MTDDYQIGEHTIDSESSLSGELVEFDYENVAIFKRLAEDIYESGDAGIREPIQNSITAIKNAQNNCYISEDEGIINITAKDGEMTEITIQDNGIGIKEDLLKNVLSVIGRSTNRDDGDVSGKFGMGFLAFYKLVGTDGGFMMHSKSRETDEEIKGFWKPFGFEKDDDDVLPDLIDNEYGTCFQLNTNYDVQEIRNWVEKHSELARVPIRYEEKNEDGEIVYDEEYGNAEITDIHHSDDNTIEFNDEYFRCVVSLSNPIRTYNESRFYLMNSPVKYNMKTNSIIDEFKATIRLKNENGIIVAGPNKGLTPISNAEYKKMSDKRKNNYIPQSEVKDEDIQIPQPTGTREKITGDETFVQYLSDTIEDKTYRRFVNIIKDIENVDDLFKFTEFELISDLKDALEKMNYDINKIVNNNSGISNSDMIHQLFNIRRVITEDMYRKRRKLYEIIKMVDNPDDVYMFVTENENKIEAIRENFENPVFIELDRSADYKRLERFGFRKVKHVNRYLDDYEDESGSSDDNLEDRNVNIRFNKKHKVDTRNMRVGDIPDEYVGSGDTLVLFPSSTDKNVTDYDCILTESVHTCNTLVSIADYLTEFDNIVEIEEYIKRINDKEVTTSHGTLTVRELSKKVDLDEHIVVLDEHDSTYIKQNMSVVQKIIYDHINDDYSYNFILDDCIMNTDNVENYNNIVYIPNSDEQNVETHMSVNNGYNYDYKIRGLEDMHILINEFKDEINEETYSVLMDMLPVDLYDGVRKDVKRLIDTELEDTNPLKESVFITDEGELNGVELVEEAKDNELIAHIVTSYEKHIISEHVDSFSDEVCNKIFKVNNDDVIYVVLDKSEYDLIREKVEADVLINSYKTSYSLLSFDHTLRTSELYKKARLDGFENVNFEGRLDVIDELSE